MLAAARRRKGHLLKLPMTMTAPPYVACTYSRVLCKRGSSGGTAAEGKTASSITQRGPEARKERGEAGGRGGLQLRADDATARGC